MRQHPDKQGWVQGPFERGHEGRTLICVEDSLDRIYGLDNTYTLIQTPFGPEAKGRTPYGFNLSLDCGWFMFVDSPPTEDELKEMIG